MMFYLHYTEPGDPFYFTVHISPIQDEHDEYIW
jgi:hypothetical protein